MAKILAVLYSDPIDGYPTQYARDTLPTIDRYPNGQTVPSPKPIDFTAGELLGSVTGGLGLRRFLEDAGHTFVVTTDLDAGVVISQPFWPAYLDADRIAKAKNLTLAITAGIGSAHVDLTAANDRNLTVAEITYSNGVSVAEHAVMQILALVRIFVPAHQLIREGAGTSPMQCRARPTLRG